MDSQWTIKCNLRRKQPVVRGKRSAIVATRGQADGATIVAVIVINLPVIAVTIGVIDQPAVELIIGLKVPQDLPTVLLEAGLSSLVCSLEGNDFFHLATVVASHHLCLGGSCLLGRHGQCQCSHQSE